MPTWAVAAPTTAGDVQYLLKPGLKPAWVRAQEEAALFGSLREATQVATRLPSAARAYAMPMLISAKPPFREAGGA